MVGKRHWEIKIDGNKGKDDVVSWPLEFKSCNFVYSVNEGPSLPRMRPAWLMRIRPEMQMSPLAVRLLALGMARTMEGLR